MRTMRFPLALAGLFSLGLYLGCGGSNPTSDGGTGQKDGGDVPQGDKPDGTGGTGGAGGAIDPSPDHDGASEEAGTGGGGGTGGTGGTGGGGGESCWPSCIADLMAMCVPAGTCMSEQTMGSPMMKTENRCFSNGVHVCMSTSTTSTTITLAATVTKMDGKTTCYTMNETIDGVARTATAVIKDGSGMIAATLSSTDAEMTKWHVLCADGKSYDVDIDRPVCETKGATCPDGTCSGCM